MLIEKGTEISAETEAGGVTVEANAGAEAHADAGTEVTDTRTDISSVQS